MIIRWIRRRSSTSPLLCVVGITRLFQWRSVYLKKDGPPEILHRDYVSDDGSNKLVLIISFTSLMIITPYISLQINRPFAQSRHMVQNHTCWLVSCTVGLPKQCKSYQSTRTCLCYGSPTAQHAHQHVRFCTMWLGRTKGLLLPSHCYSAANRHPLPIPPSPPSPTKIQQVQQQLLKRRVEGGKSLGCQIIDEFWKVCLNLLSSAKIIFKR